MKCVMTSRPIFSAKNGQRTYSILTTLTELVKVARNDS